MNILETPRLKFALLQFSFLLVVVACGGASPDVRPTPPIAQTPDYQSTQAVVNALVNLQAQAQATEAAATQSAIAINNTARELSMQETQVAADVLRVQAEYIRTVATLGAQFATATHAAAIETQEARYLPTHIAATQAAQAHDRARWDVALGVGLLAAFLVVVGGAFTAFFAIIDRSSAASTKIVQVGQLVAVVAGGRVVDTFEAQPGAQVVEHGPQLAPPQRDQRTARALQFLEVAIACPKPNDPKKWPANRLPTYDMLRQFGARDFDTGSAWQNTVKLFGELVDGTPGKGAFVRGATTLEEFYQALAAGKVALPQ